MHKTHLDSIPEDESKSPQGRYHLRRRNISIALGGKKDTGTWGGGHPFDLEWVRIPAGAANFPFHAHAAQWELYTFLEGRGEVRGPHETVPVEAGDHIIFPPGESHQVRNTGASDLVYYVIADNPTADVTTYPDTGKRGIKPERKHFEMKETSYYEPGD
jgi:uncharacterized cupin superfamily protein